MPQAKRAKEFTESVGVGAHLTREPYFTRYSQSLRQLMIDCGIKYLRDTVHDATGRDRVVDLFNTAGIKLDYLLYGSVGAEDITGQLNHVASFGNAVYAMEGVNEPDLGSTVGFESYKGTTFPEASRLFASDYYNAIKARPDLANKTIYSPTIGWAYGNAQVLGNTLGNTYDFYAMHTYQYQDRTPEHPEDTNMYNDRANLVAPGKPRVCTEIGYNTALQYRNPDNGLWTMSEQSQMKYTLRVLLYYFNLGRNKTFLHEWMDNGITQDNIDHGYGLVKYDGTPKQVYGALKNMMSILNDGSSSALSFTPGNANYTLSGDLNNLHTTLLQKADGTYYLALWRDYKAYDWQNQSNIANGSPNVTITLGSNVGEMSRYIPSLGTTKQNAAANTNTYTLPVGDEVVFVAFGSASVPVTPPPAPTNSYKVEENKVYQIQAAGTDEDVSMLYVEYTGTGYGTPTLYLDDSLIKYNTAISSITGIQEIVGRAPISTAPPITQTGVVKILRAGSTYTLTLGSPSETVIGTFLNAEYQDSTISLAKFALVMSVNGANRSILSSRITNIQAGSVTPAPEPTPSTGDIRINCGGVAFTDASGNQYIADQYRTGGTVSTTTAAIANTDKQALYQKEIWGASQYAIPVRANGRYTVNLLFAETYNDAAGQRRFNVSIEGTQVLTNFDVFAAAGAKNRAVMRTFYVTASADGILNINFINSTAADGTPANAAIKAIEVLLR